ncbi:MAG TPA: hypothetical protein VN516_04685 [Candidatus Baltobacteraceae bacterium]|nr:hypothetical protein [Candidatus Baltobacteraceae bacterium]
MHAGICETLFNASAQLLSGGDQKNVPAILGVGFLQTIFTFPLGFLANAFRIEHFPIWFIHALRMFNSAMWGIVIALIVHFIKRSKPKKPVLQSRT